LLIELLTILEQNGASWLTYLTCRQSDVYRHRHHHHALLLREKAMYIGERREGGSSVVTCVQRQAGEQHSAGARRSTLPELTSQQGRGQ